jgi:hypothetical protein
MKNDISRFLQDFDIVLAFVTIITRLDLELFWQYFWFFIY